MSLRSVNLNLLPVLRAILRERNLSRAAKSLGLTQPAVSAALVRLRFIFGDPLIVRKGRSMELTLRGHELIEAVEEVCGSLEALMGSEAFEPAQCERRFVIVSADYAVVALAPMIIRQLALHAPKASVHFVDLPHPTLEAHPGEIDFFILPELLFREGSHPPLRWIPLITDELVTIVAEDHRLAKVARPSKADLQAERYVLYYPALSFFEKPSLGAIVGLAQGRNIAAQIQQFSLLPALVMDTGCASIVPRRVAEYMQRFMPIRLIHEVSPIEFDACLSWKAASENDPAHRWFRKMLIDCCRTRHEDEALASDAKVDVGAR